MTTDDDFRDFVRARQSALWRSAVLLTGDAALAEDLVQTALLKCWPRWRRVAAGAGPEAYVRRVMLTTYISWRRRSWRREIPHGVVPDVAVQMGVAAGDVADVVRTALLRLPARQRAAVVLRYFDDLSERETAAVLGCSVGTVKSQTARGLARLREHLLEAGDMLNGAST